jgi:hypothetical protein
MAKDMIISLKGGQQAPAPQMPEREPEREFAPPPSRREFRRKMDMYKRIAYGIGTLIIIVGAWVLYRSWNPPASTTVDPNTTPAQQEEAAQLEISTLIERVGKLIVLPEGEEPTVATVSDPAKLKDQVFFANAKVGDKVLIYTKARKAYLYDPEGDILLEVAPITADGI